MRAVQLSRFGSPDVLELIETPTPVPQAGEVLIEIHASGVNYFEVLMRQDRYAVTPELPTVFGVETAGTIVRLGEGINLPVGSRVAVPLFAFGRYGGGYADYIAVDAGAVIPIPDDLSFEVAVALMVQGLTALHAHRRSPPKDKTVLVTAAAGGVGSLMVQLAKRAGAHQVIAAAGSAAKLDLVRSLGADVGVNYTDAGWSRSVLEVTAGRGVDLIYDFVGGVLTTGCIDVLAPSGELVFGALGRVGLDSATLETLFARNQSLKGFALLPLLTPDNVRADLAELFTLAASNELKVMIGGRYPLAEVADAHRAIEERRTMGKVVLTPCNFLDYCP